MNRSAFLAVLIPILLLAYIGDVVAAGALESVRIYKGLNQTRPPQTSQTIGRRYVWNFGNDTYTAIMTIDIENYNSYTSRERDDFTTMVKVGRDALQDLIAEFHRIMSSFGTEQKVNFVLAFVQSLPYTKDDVTTGHDDFRRYAVETLIDGGGDCEDTSVLAASIIGGLGFGVALITFPGHIGLGVKGDFSGTRFLYSGTPYYYCETTGTGWELGKLPESYVSRKTQIMPIAVRSIRKPSITIPPNPPRPSVTTKLRPSRRRVVRNPARPDDSLAFLILIIIIAVIIGGALAVFLLTRLLKGNAEPESDTLKTSDRSSSDPLDSI